jgi:hypothetical protein
LSQSTDVGVSGTIVVEVANVFDIH